MGKKQKRKKNILRKSPIVIIILALLYGGYSYFNLDRYLPIDEWLASDAVRSIIGSEAQDTLKDTLQNGFTAANEESAAQAAGDIESFTLPSGADSEASFSPDPEDGLLHFASWNVRILSDSSRNHEELSYIAAVMEQYEFIAVQELRDTDVLDRLMDMLPPSYDCIVSEPVGRGVKELYAYIYDERSAEFLGTAYVFPDEHDVFIREPFIADFRADQFDFTVITMHSIYGDSVDNRRVEASRLDDALLKLTNGQVQRRTSFLPAISICLEMIMRGTFPATSI